MSHKRLTFIFLSLFTVSLTAQTGFERIFPVDMSIEHLTIDGTDFEDGYLKLALTTERDSATYESANITKIDLKGAILWSRDLVVEDSLELMTEGDLMILENGNIAVSLVSMKDSMNHFIALTDPSGNLLWTKRYAVYQDSSAFSLIRPRLIQSKIDTGSIFLASAGLYEDRAQVYVSKLDANSGLVQWSNYIGREDAGLEFGAITACMDGGAMITGIDLSNSQFFVSKIDEDGNQLFNKSITSNIMPIPTETVANDIIQLQDSSYVLVGNYRTQNVEDDGYIMSLDTLANVNWSKRVDFDFSFNDVDLLHVIESQDDALIVAAKQVGFLDTAAFALKLDYDGNVIWQNKYKDIDLENIHLAGLGHSTINGGMSYFLTGGNEEEQYIAYLIATDAEGNTLCNDVIDATIVFDEDFQADTLELNLMDFEAFYKNNCCEGYTQMVNDEPHNLTTAKTFNGSSYLAGSFIRNGETIASFSKFDAQNDVVWSYELSVASRIRDFEITDNNEFLVVGNTLPNDDNESFILKIDDNGNLVDSRTYNFNGREFITRIEKHSNPLNPAFQYYMGGIKNPDSNFPSTIDESFVGNIDENLNVNWVTYFNGGGTDEQLSRFTCMADGNVIVYGSNGSSTQGRVSVLNGMDGSQISSFTSDQTQFFQDMHQLSNGLFVATSFVDLGNIAAPEVSLLDAELNVLDSDFFGTDQLTAIQNITLINDNNFYVTSRGQDDNNLLLSYEIMADSTLSLADVFTLEEEEVGLFNSALDFENTNYVYAQSIVRDSGREILLGSGTIDLILDCMVDTTLNPVNLPYSLDSLPLDFAQDTFPNFTSDITLNNLELLRDDFCYTESFAECVPANVEINNFDSYSLPVIMLEVRPFCPNEPLIWTFNAQQQGAVAWEWMNEDGDVIGTADTLTVTEVGDYNVAVTMGEDVCYVLCDTATLDVYEEPMIMISDQISCQSGTIVLTALPTAEAGVDSLFWSTGELGPTIAVSTLGDYTVTMIDNCGIEVSASITLDDSNIPSPSVDIVQTDMFCNNGTFSLEAQLGNGTGPISSVTWSTNEMTNPILVNQAGPYSVTIVDACGQTASASTEVDLPILVETIELVTDFTDFCNGQYGLQVVVNPSNAPLNGISWTTPSGSTLGGQSITGTEGGTYTVTVTDTCGNILTQSAVAPETPQAHTFDTYTLAGACMDGMIQLSINELIPGTFTYLWSNGETTSTITVPVEQEVYTVQIFDECGDARDGEFEVTDGACGFLNFPNVFFPDNSQATDRNTNFGPILFNAGGGEVTEEELINGVVTDYVLEVYNRWGEKVFETDDFLEHWDGMYKEKAQPNDVYLFIATYKFNGRDDKFTDDVTLMR